MSAYPAWTPASRPGIVPLHPLGFGTLLGRSFAALRHNPRVLLGFALGVQGVAYLITVVVVAAVAFATFGRLANTQPGSNDYEQITAGSVGILIIVALVMSLALSAFTVLVQGVVVVDVARGVLAERPTLREIWAQVRPGAWRLIGYAALLMLAAVVGIAVAAAIAVAAGAANVAAGIVVAVLALLAAVPLWLCLNAKLALVPAAILLENATVGGGIARSWRLTRRRFWPVLGVLFVIQAAFFALGEAVAVPASFIGGIVSSIVAPTGDLAQAEAVQFVSLAVTEVIVLLIQVVGSIVQATASALLYVDCRMRHEGLDLDLLGYVERRDAGETGLADPFTMGIGRVAAPRYPAQWGATSPQWGAQAPQWGAQAAPQQWGPPPVPAQWGPPPVVPAGPAAAAPPASPARPASDDPPASSVPPPMAPPR